MHSLCIFCMICGQPLHFSSLSHSMLNVAYFPWAINKNERNTTDLKHVAWFCCVAVQSLKLPIGLMSASMTLMMASQFSPWPTIYWAYFHHFNDDSSHLNVVFIVSIERKMRKTRVNVVIFIRSLPIKRNRLQKPFGRTTLFIICMESVNNRKTDTQWLKIKACVISVAFRCWSFIWLLGDADRTKRAVKLPWNGGTWNRMEFLIRIYIIL